MSQIIQTMTPKQVAQTWAQIEEMERRTRGNELETPFIVLVRICRDYVAQSGSPDMQQAARANLIARLDKFRVKYFEKI